MKAGISNRKQKSEKLFFGSYYFTKTPRRMARGKFLIFKSVFLIFYI